MKTKIYGASDDLIEIDGAIEDEIGTIMAGKNIVCSDGTAGHICYTDSGGEWKIDLVSKGTKFLKLVESVGDDAKHSDDDAIGFSSYSDVLVLDEGIEWIKVGTKTFKA